MTLGQKALAAGEGTEASRWLERAHRIAPSDGTIMLLWASTLIGNDNAKAAALFAEVLNSADVRHAWMGLASARLLSRDTFGAQAAVAKLLGRHAWQSDMASLVNRIVEETGAPGWCGLTGDGVVIVHSAQTARIGASIDGQALNREPAAGNWASHEWSTTDWAPTDQIGDVMKFLLPAHWFRARRIVVMCGERHLVGSPMAPAAIGRIEGYVETTRNGLHGWAWHPAEPDTNPSISVLAAGRSRLEIIASNPASGIAGLAPLARPRSFFIPWNDLPVGDIPCRLLGRDGRDLTGSPIARIGPDLLGGRKVTRRKQRTARPHLEADQQLSKPDDSSSHQGAAGRRKLAVIIVSPEGCEVRENRIEAISATIDASVRIVLVRPGRRRPQRSRSKRVSEVRGGIEAAVSVCPGHDLILLDSGATLPFGWLQRLCDAAYIARGIGTVTPFSNRGIAAYPTSVGCELEWFSRPGMAQDLESTPVTEDLDERTTRWLDGLTGRANRRNLVPVATGGGPCLFIHGDCLAEVGRFRPEFFAQGDGVQQDFCARASAVGWRNIVLPGLFIGLRELPSEDSDPSGWRSSAEWRQLHERNTSLLERLHPGFSGQLKRSAARLARSRRRLDIARWDLDSREATILVTHNDGGGVERRVEAAVAEKTAHGRRAIVLRPSSGPNGRSEVCVDGSVFPNLRFDIPREQTALWRLLCRARIAEAEIHHFLGHHSLTIETICSLGFPFDCHIHDYVWFCPRVALVGRENRYCGEPEVAACESCVAKLGSYLQEVINPGALVDRSRDILSGARRVIAPSRDAARRMTRHFRDLSLTVIPHEDDDAVEDPSPIPLVEHNVRICVAGAIGVHKGFEVLLACAQDAAKHQLDLTFIVAGTTIDDRRLMDTGKVWVTGPYQPDEAVELIRAQRAALGFLPSIWPETWCLTLTELWRAGLRVAAFDIGAPAERIRRTGRGFLLSAQLSSGAINEILLRSVRSSSFASDPASFGLEAPR